MRVNTCGGVWACVAVAVTRSPSSGCRFFSRILTTSTLVHPHSAISTASMGLGPCSCAGSASKNTECPLSEIPSKIFPPFHSLCAIIFVSPHSRVLSQIISRRLGVNRHPVDLRTLQLETILKPGDHLVYAPHRQFVGQCAMAGEMNVLAGAAHDNFMHIHNLLELAGRCPQGGLDLAILDDLLLRLLDGGRLAFNVRQHRVD